MIMDSVETHVFMCITCVISLRKYVRTYSDCFEMRAGRSVCVCVCEGVWGGGVCVGGGGGGTGKK